MRLRSSCILLVPTFTRFLLCFSCRHVLVLPLYFLVSAACSLVFPLCFFCVFLCRPSCACISLVFRPSRGCVLLMPSCVFLHQALHARTFLCSPAPVATCRAVLFPLYPPLLLCTKPHASMLPLCFFYAFRVLPCAGAGVACSSCFALHRTVPGRCSCASLRRPPYASSCASFAVMCPCFPCISLRRPPRARACSVLSCASQHPPGSQVGRASNVGEAHASLLLLCIQEPSLSRCHACMLQVDSHNDSVQAARLEGRMRRCCCHASTSSCMLVWCCCCSGCRATVFMPLLLSLLFLRKSSCTVA